MKNKKTIIIGLASLLVLAGLIITIVLFNNNNKLENRLTKLATDYFENNIKEIGSDKAYYMGYYMVVLNDLKSADKDISMFEKKSCDMTDTYAKLTFKEDKSYDVEVHLNCEK